MIFMKKRQEPRLPRISADETASNLRTLGHRANDDKLAKRIANYYAKTLGETNAADLDDKIFRIKDIQKSARFWKQVSNILAKR